MCRLRPENSTQTLHAPWSPLLQDSCPHCMAAVLARNAQIPWRQPMHIINQDETAAIQIDETGEGRIRSCYLHAEKLPSPFPSSMRPGQTRLPTSRDKRGTDDIIVIVVAVIIITVTVIVAMSVFSGLLQYREKPRFEQSRIVSLRSSQRRAKAKPISSFPILHSSSYITHPRHTTKYIIVTQLLRKSRNKLSDLSPETQRDQAVGR